MLNRRSFFAASAAGLAWAKGLLAGEPKPKARYPEPGTQYIPARAIPIHANGRFSVIAGEDLEAGDYIGSDAVGCAVKIKPKNYLDLTGCALESKNKGEYVRCILLKSLA